MKLQVINDENNDEVKNNDDYDEYDDYDNDDNVQCYKCGIQTNCIPVQVCYNCKTDKSRVRLFKCRIGKDIKYDCFIVKIRLKQ